MMATDYEKFYRKHKNGLGEPTKEFVTFFNAYTPKKSKVLDVGCGQGRDALFIARQGHIVTAIDKSPTGIHDLQTAAANEGLVITTEIIDICDYKPTITAEQNQYDIILIDRTLHMLKAEDQLIVLRNLLAAPKSGMHLLIADEPSNIPAFKTVLKDTNGSWKTTLEHQGFLFVQRK